MTAVEQLERWFASLPESQKREVLDHLYGRSLLIKGQYLGPHPAMVKKGVYLGPKPSESSMPSVCPTCGR